MALTNLISGELRNKIGGMVGAKWKGKNYVRAYVVPKDAKTEAQLAVRSVMTILGSIGAAINPYILKPYTAKTFKNMSAYNRFVKINKALVSASAPDWANLKIFSGGALGLTALTAAADSATSQVTINASVATQIVTPDSEKIFLVACNTTQNITTYTILDWVDGTADYDATLYLPCNTDDVIVVSGAVYTLTTIDGEEVKNNSDSFAVTATAT